MVEMKTRENDADVIAFLNGVADDRRRQDCLALVALMEDATGAQAKMWGEAIVGFGSYHYKYASGREGDWFLAGFSPRKQNLTIYISAGFEPYETLMAELGKYKTGKSCLYVKRLDDIKLETLRELVKQAAQRMAAHG
jgi:hypothetical protein